MTVCMVSSLTPTALFLESSKVTEEWLFKKKKMLSAQKHQYHGSWFCKLCRVELLKETNRPLIRD